WRVAAASLERAERATRRGIRRLACLRAGCVRRRRRHPPAVRPRVRVDAGWRFRRDGGLGAGCADACRRRRRRVAVPDAGVDVYRFDEPRRPSHLALGAGRFSRRFRRRWLRWWRRLRRQWRLPGGRWRFRRRRRLGRLVMAGKLARSWAHLLSDSRSVRRVFDDDLLARIEAAITSSERAHSAEVRVAIEASLPIGQVWRGRTPRERALEVFGALGVWDTAANN